MKLVQRKIKGRAYLYLERTMRVGEKKWKKVYLYVGTKRPSGKELASLKKKLQKKVSDYIKKEIVGPNTQFLDAKTAMKLERIKNSHANLLNSMDKANRAAFIERQRAQFITNTNAIEGSRITLDQTEKLLKLRRTYEADKDELEVLNMEDCLSLYDQYLRKGAEIDEKMLLRLHLALLKAIPGYEEHGGVWRTVNVFIRTSRYEFPHWKNVPGLMYKLLKWHSSNSGKMHPMELAARFHAMLVTIHPFADENGRMARLLMNYILQKNGFPFIDIPYERRDEYFATQEKAHFGDFQPFVNFLVAQMARDYKKMRMRF
ncbi:MAG: Fic family protein [Candidatus Micrarchaeia archaeon]|jgi:Fic family protein